MTPSSISWVWPKRPDGWRSERNRWARPPGPTRPACSLLAADAAPNTVRRAAHFGEAGGALWLQMPFTKAELGEQLGRSSCAMLAVTDFGVRRRPGGEAGRSGRGAVRPRSSAAEAKAGPRPDAPERKTPAREKYETGKAQALGGPALSPQQEGRGPADNVQAGAGQRRLRQTAGQAGDRDGESAPNIPRETGARAGGS